MISVIPNTSITGIGHVMAQNGKISIPVAPASMVYSHLQHVSGIPAPEGTQGVTITKLNVLDALIGQLDQVKKGGASLGPGLKNGSLESIIENFTNQIRQAKADNALMPYLPSPSAQPGALFSFTA